MANSKLEKQIANLETQLNARQPGEPLVIVLIERDEHGQPLQTKPYNRADFHITPTTSGGELWEPKRIDS